MKKTSSLLVALSAVVMLFMSSRKDDEVFSLSAPKLSVDNTSLSIAEYTDDVALTFTWTDAADGRTDVALQTMLMIAKAEDSGFAACTDFTVQGLSKSLTYNELRDAAAAIKADLNQGETLLAKVMVMAEGKTVYSNVVEFYAIKSVEGYETLYPIGAMNWGWDPTKAEQMHTDDGVVYTWIGNINAGQDFKFLCNNDGVNWIPSYNRDAEAENYWTLYKKTEDWQPDTQFKVEKTGQYKITLNIKDLTISCEPNSDGMAKLYPIGAMAWGWNLEEAEEMETMDGITYTWTGEITAGLDFKIECQKTAWQPSYNRDANAENYWTAYYKTQDWEPDTQWKVDATGIYTLSINIETLLVTAEPQFDPENYEKIYPIGAMSWGWDPTQAEQMTTTNGQVYTWTGLITGGADFKFLCNNDGVNWIPSYNRDAEAENYWTAFKKTEDWQPDTQWKVDETANYNVTLDIVNLTLSVEKIVERPMLYPIGAMAWGWNLEDAQPMTSYDDVNFHWAGAINGGADFKFMCSKSAWIPSYNRNADAADYWTLCYRDQEWMPDTQFVVEESGDYIIDINTETLSISCFRDHTSEFPPIYPIGAMAWGWNLDQAERMTTQDGETYTWAGEVKANNDFKFMCDNTAWIPSYNRDENAEDYWTAFYKTEDWQPDTQFKVTESGIYTLTLNVKSLKVTAEKIADVR